MSWFVTSRSNLRGTSDVCKTAREGAAGRGLGLQPTCDRWGSRHLWGSGDPIQKTASAATGEYMHVSQERCASCIEWCRQQAKQRSTYWER